MGTQYPVGMVMGTRTQSGYIVIRLGCIGIQAHRLAWFYVYGKWPSEHIDHINGNPSDNRIDNLREVDQLRNAWNSKKSATNRSGYKGVSWHRSAKRWQAQLTHKGQSYHLGYFDSQHEAAKAYEDLALILRGDHHRKQKIKPISSTCTTNKRNGNRYTVSGAPPSKYHRLIGSYHPTKGTTLHGQPDSTVVTLQK